ncbi:X2-like carbohydrate binding domain-containing protein [Cohnella sp. WQ 127256]|uniref:X2-like carbohydrate binding domain-containing protein n=1 Tax=Cohnella sp. WQ 127256 TaxID=2938790 RepID=UPI0021193743|nr:X2-like carbohydrate binding domain-containing protein [Cohnella sp. WQ 127256]
METYVKRNYGKVIVQKLKSGLACLLVICLLMTALLATPSSASANMKLGDVAVGTHPIAAAVNPVTNKIYVANHGSSTVTVVYGATNTTTTVPVGDRPVAVAVNPVTNKIYVANLGSNNVTVIDGATNATTTVQAGTHPTAVAVNSVTNKIYVANSGSDDVTVIDGATNTTTPVPVGDGPSAVAVNPVTNKIYVANEGGSSVTVIDGATNATMSVPMRTAPNAVAVNPVTNKIYVSEMFSSDVTVIDGATNQTMLVPVGDDPIAVAVNPVTNKIYVANSINNDVTVIDGTTNTTTLVPVGNSQDAVAVNPVTNKIYVAIRNSHDVKIIDGATNTTTSVQVGDRPVAVAVNPVTNKIYVANEGGNTVTVIDGATHTTTPVQGTTPYAVAVNPVTNKIYVANNASNDVTVIDGSNNLTTAVSVGHAQSAIAVNPVTNKIYVADMFSGSVTVIDGATHTTTSVQTGRNPAAIAVNPVTNKIYVADRHGTVTVIDGATHTTTTLQTGGLPYAVAVNPVTNKIYVSNGNSADVTVIDGATNQTTTVQVGDAPFAVAVNPVTNKIYVANMVSGSVTVIDGANNTTKTVQVGTFPQAVAVNSVTNKIYVANSTSNNVTVIDGATDTTTTVAVGTTPRAVTMNPVTNKIYAVNFSSDTVTVIDGVTHTTMTVQVGDAPETVAVNPLTNKIYVTNRDSHNVTVIDDARRTTNPLEVEVMPLPNNKAYGTDATFTFQVSNGYSPYASVVQSVYFQFDTTQGPWVQANPSGSDWTATVSSLTYGQHELFVLALEAQGDGVPAGVANSYSFYSVPPNSISPTSASFDLHTGSAGNADVSTTFALNGNTLTSIANGATNLAAGTDYTVSGNTSTISKAYLAAQPVGTTRLTFTFSGGATQTLEITVSDSTPTISPTSVSFDKYTGSAGHADVSTTLVLNGYNLTSIANGATNLAAGTDYTVSGSTITISKAYLATQPVGPTSLTFTFVGGTSKTLAITVSDSTPTISPTSARFDKYSPTNVSTTLALYGDTLTSIANGATNLAAGTDYTVSGNTITISKAYLVEQTVGMTNLTFTFSGGATQTLAITVSHSSSAVRKLVIDVNGTTVDPDSIDTTKPFVAFEVTPKDGAAYVSIPATILTDMANKNAAFYFDIKAPYGSYQVPVQLASFIPGLADLLAANRLKSEDISFKMTLIDRSGDQEIQAALADSLPKRKVMGEIVDYQIDIINTNTKQTIGNADKLTKALTKYIPMPKSMKDMPAQWGAFRYNESRKKFEFVAAKPVQIGGIRYVKINSYFNAPHVVVENAATFTDTLTHWGKSFVELAAAKGLVEGVGNGQFAPNKTVTRAEFTAMLVRALGRGQSIGSAVSYVDVKSGAWYYEEVATAKELGLLDFVRGTSFNPEQLLTREEMASMLAAAVELEKLPLTKNFVSLDGFKDIAPADSAYLEDVRLMVKLHIMTGTGKNKFSLKGETTRAQAAVVLIRTLQVLDRIDGYKE